MIVRTRDGRERKIERSKVRAACDLYVVSILLGSVVSNLRLPIASFLAISPFSIRLIARCHESMAWQGARGLELQIIYSCSGFLGRGLIASKPVRVFEIASEPTRPANEVVSFSGLHALR